MVGGGEEVPRPERRPIALVTRCLSRSGGRSKDGRSGGGASSGGLTQLSLLLLRSTEVRTAEFAQMFKAASRTDKGGSRDAGNWEVKPSYL